MRVFIEKENKEVNDAFSGSAGELLKKLKINPETVLIVKNNELITADEDISDWDHIKILSVVSGG